MAPTKEISEHSTANQKKLKQQTDESSDEEAAPVPKKKSSSKKDKPKKKKRSSKKSEGGLGLIKSDPTETLSGLGQGVIGGGHQQQQGGGKSGGDHPLSLRLDLNLEVEITLKARVHGDVTLALLA